MFTASCRPLPDLTKHNSKDDQQNLTTELMVSTLEKSVVRFVAANDSEHDHTKVVECQQRCEFQPYLV